MNSLDYTFLTTHVQEKSGLVLGAGKEYFVEGRLVPLARSLGFADLGELVAELKSRQNPQLSTAVVEAMTINETSFFRDESAFKDFQSRVLPSLIVARRADPRPEVLVCRDCVRARALQRLDDTRRDVSAAQGLDD